MSRNPTAAEREQAAEVLDAIVAEIDGGELGAEADQAAFLRGARAALRVSQSERIETPAAEVPKTSRRARKASQKSVSKRSSRNGNVS